MRDLRTEYLSVEEEYKVAVKALESALDELCNFTTELCQRWRDLFLDAPNLAEPPDAMKDRTRVPLPSWDLIHRTMIVQHHAQEKVLAAYEALPALVKRDLPHPVPEVLKNGFKQ